MTEPSITPTATPDDLRKACQTLSGMPEPNPELVAKLKYVGEMLADAGPLPPFPLLVWRETDSKVHHAIIRKVLVAGRAPGTGLAFSEDRLLSRQHFSVSVTEDGYLLRDLESKNGTAINAVSETVSARLLRDGDLILAGNHIFAFLDQTQVA